MWILNRERFHGQRERQLTRFKQQILTVHLPGNIMSTEVQTLGHIKYQNSKLRKEFFSIVDRFVGEN